MKHYDASFVVNSGVLSPQMAFRQLVLRKLEQRTLLILSGEIFMPRYEKLLVEVLAIINLIGQKKERQKPPFFN